MVGPDLTNQIVGTLIRFRQERIAFVADIEMFFQVLVRIDVCNDDKVKSWYLGPQFLWEPEATWDDYKVIPPVNKKDPELKKEFVVCLATKPVDVLTALENRISDWSKMVRVVALVIKFKEVLLSKINQHEIIRKVKSTTLLNTSLLQEAKTKLVKMVQQRSFKDEFRWLKSLKNSSDLNKALDKRSKISCLDPFLDGDEVIHVGGRLENSFLNNECKHPILLPKVGKITELLIKYHHKLAAHSG